MWIYEPWNFRVTSWDEREIFPNLRLIASLQLKMDIEDHRDFIILEEKAFTRQKLVQKKLRVDVSDLTILN